jgi:hypothetical protein
MFSKEERLTEQSPTITLKPNRLEPDPRTPAETAPAYPWTFEQTFLGPILR